MYEIIPEALRSTNSAKKSNPGPHADGVVGSVNSPTAESLTKQLHQLSVKHSTVEEAKAAPSPQNANVFAQSSQNGNKKPGGKRRKERKVRETKTSQNPKTMLMGGKNKRRRLKSHVNCASKIT